MLLWKRLEYLNTLFHELSRPKLFGFVEGHSYLCKDDLAKIQKLIGNDSEEVISSYEKAYAELIGDGEALSYASGRMAFYEVLNQLELNQNDEVILLGFTCSVMVNAVLRIGAIPVFSDVDPDTFGSSASSIKKLITAKTKVIVAQHSFGIPCEIKKIQKLAKDCDIFLIEDCALTFGSAKNGVIVGNFGDAAIFSTDHSKPLNTLIGGLAYSRDSKFVAMLKKSHTALPHLPKFKQKALWKRLLLERRFCDAGSAKYLGFVDLFQSLIRKILSIHSPFLDEDGGVPIETSYSYPSKLPTFLAAVGLFELRRWPEIEKARTSYLDMFIGLFREKKMVSCLPKAYFDKDLSIVPLRFAWAPVYGEKLRLIFREFIKVSWIWFIQPIVGCSTSFEKMGYHVGSCSNSEQIGKLIMNLPCNMPRSEMDLLLSRVRKYLK